MFKVGDIVKLKSSSLTMRGSTLGKLNGSTAEITHIFTDRFKEGQVYYNIKFITVVCNDKQIPDLKEAGQCMWRDTHFVLAKDYKDIEIKPTDLINLFERNEYVG